MPWMIPSHQAAVLPLKQWRPAWFSGLALVLGSVAPDLVFIFRLDETGSPVSHTFAGQLLITMPLVVLLHALVTALVLPWLLPRVPGGPPLHLHALARCRPATGPLALARVAVSGLVGGLSHVAIDGFTHGDHSGWALPLFPALATPLPLPFAPAPLYDVLQVTLTVVLGLLAVRAWDGMARRLPQPGPGAMPRWQVTGAGRQESLSAASGLALAAVTGALLAAVLKSSVAPADLPKLAVYGAITGGCAGAVLLAGADRLRGVLQRIRFEVDAALEV
ncbi:MAG TPA: DUF4184 family protein [Vicinamibacteria bacterium]|nr:DUF4184 family protein [Vicinamibacteria bacterium]